VTSCFSSDTRILEFISCAYFSCYQKYFTKWSFLFPSFSCLRDCHSKLMKCTLYNVQDLWPLMMFLDFFMPKNAIFSRWFVWIYWTLPGTVKVITLIKICMFPCSLFISIHQPLVSYLKLLCSCFIYLLVT